MRAIQFEPIQSLLTDTMASSLWQIVQRRSTPNCQDYQFVATATENENTYTIDCGWAQCWYSLSICKNGIGQENTIFVRFLLADANPDKFVNQIIRIAHRDIENKVARLDRMHRDMVLGIAGLTNRCS
jgi:hypothetical protein